MREKGITRERTGLILQELLKVLWAFADGIQAEKAAEIVASHVQLTEGEKEENDVGSHRFNEIIASCVANAVKADWMIINDGIWSVTSKGIAALKRYPQPEEFYREAGSLYRQWQRKRELVTKMTYEVAEAQAWKEIDNHFEAMASEAFQSIIGALLKAMGYFIAWTSPSGKDGGIAFIASHTAHSTRPPSIKVQARRRKEAIGIEEMHRFLASLNEGDEGILVSTGGFSKDAQEYARSNGQNEIKLYDTRRLIDLWINYSPNIPQKKLALLPLRPIYFITPPEDQEAMDDETFEQTRFEEDHPPESLTENPKRCNSANTASR